jgi:hypothetical protein
MTLINRRIFLTGGISAIALSRVAHALGDSSFLKATFRLDLSCHFGSDSKLNPVCKQYGGIAKYPPKCYQPPPASSQFAI